MAWTDEAWKSIEGIYELILNDPFVNGLGDGTLSEPKFMRFMVQDKMFLESYSRALSLIAARAPSTKASALWSRMSIECATCETQVHKYFFENLTLTDDLKRELESGIKNPSNEMYTSFVLRHAALSPFPVAVASVLPCFWVYEAVGHRHAKLIKEKNLQPTHKYYKWVETYINEEFQQATEAAKYFCNKLAEESTPEIRKEMTRAFITATYGELMFWKAAYNDEQWPH